MLLALSQRRAGRLGVEQHRQAVVEPLVDIRSKMVHATSRGQPIYPVVLELKELVLGETRRTIVTLLNIHPAISLGEIFAYDAGSFAKETCIPGSDLDLNVAYEGDNLAAFRHFEDVLKCTLGYVFNISPFAVQHNDLGIASENVEFVEWLRESRWGSLTENVRLRDSAISSTARALKRRGRLSVFGMDLNMLINASAIRHPDVIYIWGLS